MKLVFYIESLGTGGAERVLSVMINKMVSKGIICQVIVCSKAQPPFYSLPKQVQLTFLNFEYERLNYWQKIKENIKRIYLTRKSIVDSKADICVSFLSHCNVRVALSLTGLNTPLMCCEHNHYYAVKSKVLQLFRNFVYQHKANAVTVLTTRDVKNYPVTIQDKLIVLPNPLGISIPNSDITPTSKRKKQILAVGRMTEQKAFDRLLTAFSKASKLEALDEWELVIAGDGDELLSLKDMAKELNISNKVNWLGNVNNIETFYQSAGIYIMTSRWEGLPMVLGEAMQFSLPIIAYDCPTGPREFIKDSVNGFLIKDGDEDVLVNKIALLCSDKDLREQMGLKGRELSNLYSSDKVLNRWVEVFKTILGDNHV